MTAPIQVSPLEFLITAAPSISPSRIAAGAGADLGVAADPVHRDRAGAGVQVERAGLVEVDVAGGGLDPALAEAAAAVEGRDRGVAVHAGAGRQLDVTSTEPGLPSRPRPRGRGALISRPSAVVLDPGLLGGADVRLAATRSLGRT